jgi:hypothetical protein
MTWTALPITSAGRFRLWGLGALAGLLHAIGALSLIGEAAKLPLHVCLGFGDGLQWRRPTGCSRSGFSLFLLALTVPAMHAIARVDTGTLMWCHVRDVEGHAIGYIDLWLAGTHRQDGLNFKLRHYPFAHPPDRRLKSD